MTWRATSSRPYQGLKDDPKEVAQQRGLAAVEEVAVVVLHRGGTEYPGIDGDEGRLHRAARQQRDCNRALRYCTRLRGDST
jgi:hypothetical protein